MLEGRERERMDVMSEEEERKKEERDRDGTLWLYNKSEPLGAKGWWFSVSDSSKTCRVRLLEGGGFGCET